MATLYITELKSIIFAGNQAVLAPASNTITAEQDVAIGGSSVQSAAFAATTNFVMVNCDSACSLAWGANPTAVTTAHRLGANETRFYGVIPGQKLAVIANT